MDFQPSGRFPVLTRRQGSEGRLRDCAAEASGTRPCC
jgi:hypothetical protein